jgi:hypothetical protein
MTTLIDLIVDQYERSEKWNNKKLGNSSYSIKEKDLKNIKILIDQAKELEKQKQQIHVFGRAY